MRPISTPGPLALAMPYTWEELSLAECSLSASKLARAVAALIVRPLQVPPRRPTGTQEAIQDGQTVANLVAKCLHLRLLALDDKWMQHDRIARAIYELATGLGPQQLPLLRTMLTRWNVISPYNPSSEAQSLEDDRYDDILDNIRAVAPNLTSIGVTSCGVRVGGKRLSPLNSQIGNNPIIQSGLISLGAVGEVRPGFDMLLSSKQLRGLDLRLSEQDFYHPGEAFWSSLGRIVPRLKWLRLCIPDPIFNLGLLSQHFLDEERTASYPVAVSQFASCCVGLRSLTIRDNGAERIETVLSQLPLSAQLHELRIELRGAWFGDLQLLECGIPRWIQEYPCCRKLRVLDLPSAAVATHSLMVILHAKRITLRRNTDRFQP